MDRHSFGIKPRKERKESGRETFLGWTELEVCKRWWEKEAEAVVGIIRRALLSLCQQDIRTRLFFSSPTRKMCVSEREISHEIFMKMRYYFIFTVTAPEISYYFRFSSSSRPHHRNYLSIRILLRSSSSRRFFWYNNHIRVVLQYITNTTSAWKQSAKLMKMSSKMLAKIFRIFSHYPPDSRAFSLFHDHKTTAQMNGNNFYQLQHKFS